MKKYLVTGGAGFIGGHLTRRLLLEGAQVVVLDDMSSGKLANLPSGARLIQASVLDSDAVSAALEGVDACYHLAAIASVPQCNTELVQSHRVNVTGFVNIVDGIRKSGGRAALIYASSAAVYGNCQALPLTENEAPKPLSPYGADKFGCELHARAAHAVYGLNSLGFRFFNVYGEGQDPGSPYSGVITKFIDRLRAGSPLVINGDGKQTRDFVFVQDVVECLVRAVKKPFTGAEVLNVCTGVETTIADLARMLSEVVGSAPDIVHNPALSGEVRYSRGSVDKLKALLEYAPNTPLAVGLRSLAGEKVH